MRYLAATLLLILGACSRPAALAPGGSVTLFVAHAGDGTVAAVEPASGQVGNTAVPAGPAPEVIAPGPAGSLLVLSMAEGQHDVLTQLIPPARRPPRSTDASGWARRTIPLGGPVADALLASDGGRWAAAVIHPATGGAPAGVAGGTAPVAGWSSAGRAPSSHCSITIVDVAATAVARTHVVCAAGEAVRGVALDSRPDGATVYAAVQGAAYERATAAGSRVVALDALSGGILAIVPLRGTPTHLLSGPAFGASEPRVYGVELTGGPELEPPTPYAGRLLAFDGETLAPLAEYALDFAPARLAIAPDGRWAYALAGAALHPLDLAMGAFGPPVRLPERGVALAATEERVYVASAYRDELLVLDRRLMRRVRTLASGHGPVALTLVPG